MEIRAVGENGDCDRSSRFIGRLGASAEEIKLRGGEAALDKTSALCVRSDGEESLFLSRTGGSAAERQHRHTPTPAARGGTCNPHR